MYADNKKDAQDKAAQLKKDGLKDISITQHTLNFKMTMKHLKILIKKKLI